MANRKTPTPAPEIIGHTFTLWSLWAAVAATPGHETIALAQTTRHGEFLVNPHGTETRVLKILNGTVVSHGQWEEDGSWICHGPISQEDGLSWLCGGAG